MRRRARKGGVTLTHAPRAPAFINHHRGGLPSDGPLGPRLAAQGHSALVFARPVHTEGRACETGRGPFVQSAHGLPRATRQEVSGGSVVTHRSELAVFLFTFWRGISRPERSSDGRRDSEMERPFSTRSCFSSQSEAIYCVVLA
ncbi:hypothetical protein SKAU_G00334060 [Synaphobranchus kaupii]|uniref:Uncharacterized protein n=1 Tax=Synaphobranchus kaupii TaxID=118154 RepID=A0A9Q1IHV7_SYNKA|nr:hypothetical protein SKAU_G00334060 [Synaphobranchus kaupii]